jgi:hypothetical protein
MIHPGRKTGKTRLKYLELYFNMKQNKSCLIATNDVENTKKMFLN